MAQTISIIQSASQIISVLDPHGCAGNSAVSVPTVKQVITQVAVGVPGSPGEGVATLLPRLVIVEEKCLEAVNELVDLISGTPLVITSTLAEVVTVRAYQDSRDITSAITIDVDGSSVTLESNNTISNITIKLTGK